MNFTDPNEKCRSAEEKRRNTPVNYLQNIHSVLSLVSDPCSTDGRCHTVWFSGVGGSSMMWHGWSSPDLVGSLHNSPQHVQLPSKPWSSFSLQIKTWKQAEDFYSEKSLKCSLICSTIDTAPDTRHLVLESGCHHQSLEVYDTHQSFI